VLSESNAAAAGSSLNNLAGAPISEEHDVGCLNEDGVAVDWWAVYKMPGGFQYGYRDSSSSASTVLSVAAGRSLNCSDCALGKTLQQLRTHRASLAHMLWNTEFPDAYPAPSDCSYDCVFSTGGHSKGVLASSSSKGFWLIHSVPKFPDLTATAFAWETAKGEGGSAHNAQNFLCLTLRASDAEKIAKNLQHSHLHIYAWGVPPHLKSHFPNMQDTAGGKRADGTGTVSFSIGAAQFKSFSKSPSWHNDLYSALVQPELAVADGM
jgi:deoxyribonuclease-2